MLNVVIAPLFFLYILSRCLTGLYSFELKSDFPLKSFPYHYNAYVEPSLWVDLEPFFLPENHPAKPVLDKLFSKQRPTLSKEAFEKAGFDILGTIRTELNIVVGTHPKLRGFLLKFYFDTQPAFPEWHNWLARIRGACRIQECIERHHFQKIFKVPRKWIYPLPTHPSPPADSRYNRKNFILIVEDMKILSHHENRKAFKKKMTRAILDALYIVITEEGLIDSIFAGNIPFNKKGQINFVDTEHSHLYFPIEYSRVSKYLSPEMIEYWEFLIKTGGPGQQPVK